MYELFGLESIGKMNTVTVPYCMLQAFLISRTRASRIELELLTW